MSNSQLLLACFDDLKESLALPDWAQGKIVDLTEVLYTYVKIS